MRTHEYPNTREEIAENEWEEVTRERYWEMLEILPPERQAGGAFAVGEPLSHLRSVSPPVGVFDCYVRVGGRYFHRAEAIDRFDPARFTTEVKAQFGVA